MEKNRLANKRVLVVEDEKALMEAIRIKLKNGPFRALFVPNAEQAIKTLQEQEVDLIWLDLLLPGMSGLEFLKYLRAMPKWKNLPVVVISVSGGPEKINEAYGLKIQDYLVKSDHRLEELIERVADILVSSNKVN